MAQVEPNAKSVEATPQISVAAEAGIAIQIPPPHACRRITSKAIAQHCVHLLVATRQRRKWACQSTPPPLALLRRHAASTSADHQRAFGRAGASGAHKLSAHNPPSHRCAFGAAWVEPNRGAACGEGIAAACRPGCEVLPAKDLDQATRVALARKVKNGGAATSARTRGTHSGVHTQGTRFKRALRRRHGDKRSEPRNTNNTAGKHSGDKATRRGSKMDRIVRPGGASGAPQSKLRQAVRSRRPMGGSQ